MKNILLTENNLRTKNIFFEQRKNYSHQGSNLISKIRRFCTILEFLVSAIPSHCIVCKITSPRFENSEFYHFRRLFLWVIGSRKRFEKNSMTEKIHSRAEFYDRKVHSKSLRSARRNICTGKPANKTAFWEKLKWPLLTGGCRSWSAGDHYSGIF